MKLPCSAPWVTRLEFGAQATQFFAQPAQQWRKRIERVLRARRGQAPAAADYGVDGGATALSDLLSMWPASAPEIAGRLQDAIERADSRLRAEVRLPPHAAESAGQDKVRFEVWVEVMGQEGGYLFDIELDGQGRIGVDLNRAVQ